MTTRRPWKPDPEQQALWPEISGNAVNGLGEAAPRRPSPVYWHAPETIAHGPLQRWFYGRMTPAVQAARAARQPILDAPLGPLAPVPAERAPAAWVAAIREAAVDAGADDVGFARMDPRWVFEGHEVGEAWVVVLAVAHDWDALRTAPADTAAAEVIRQYGRGIRAAKGVASWIRGQGHEAVPHGGPMAPPMLLIPAAIAAGLGELGKHGSLIHRRLGSNFRLACVLTDLPLVADGADDFGADDFCTRCRACERACPPAAIGPEKQLVRGVRRWYVDFDRCLPFFNEHQGCGICLAACPWNHPGAAPNLLRKLASRRGAP